MTVSVFASPYFCSFNWLSPLKNVVRLSPFVQCMATNKTMEHQMLRRSADYHPPIWEYDYVQSLTSNYVGETYSRRADVLKEEVRMMFDQKKEPLCKLELIDTVQRLGLAYHFEVEIKRVLDGIYNDKYKSDRWNKEELFAVALEFRLLRQHGYHVPQDIFKRFTNESGNFNASLSDDTKGILYLYEASFLSTTGESLLDQARNFTTKHLKENLKKTMDHNLAVLVSHALELPQHWRVIRLEARWFIDIYEKRLSINTDLLELAKLDFNMLQATHQEDLKHMARWWKSTCMAKQLSFARDRLMENFLWTIEGNFEPKYYYFRRMVTMVNALMTTIDDIYDVYGTLEELEIFTNAIERWDIDEMEQLPEYMKLCYFTLYNSINEMASDALVGQGIYMIPYLKKTWADLCKSYLVEAKWYYSGYTPTLEEYLNNAWISISCPVMLVHTFFSVTNPVTKDALDCLEKYPDIVRWSSMIMRLTNDLGTSSIYY